jgi:hypothetical protein
MVKPEDVAFVIPADVADDVRRIEADIDKALVASGGVAMKAIDDWTPDRRRLMSVCRIFTDGGWDVTVQPDPHGYTPPGKAPLHFHVHVRKRAA